MGYSQILNRISQGQVLLMDGATGTELERRGVPMDSSAWCGPCNLDYSDVVEEVHAQYIAAGASVITANTYAASRLMLGPAGYGDQLKDIVHNACCAAKRARDRASGGRDVLVAGSIAHMVPLVPGTDVVDPTKEPTDAQVRAAISEMVELLSLNECDLIIAEMLYDRKRTPPLIETALQGNLPVWCGFSLRRSEKSQDICGFGYHEDVPQQSLYNLLPKKGVDVAGIMHSFPDVVGPGLKTLSQTYDGILMAYPESGHFEMPKWNFEEVMSCDNLIAYAQQWVEQGVRLIGGCCGLGIEHIRALNEAGIADS